MIISVYVLKSEMDGSLYIGMSNDPSRRLEEHNKGQNRSTKSGLPYKILLTEDYQNYSEARKREKFLSQV